MDKNKEPKDLIKDLGIDIINDLRKQLEVDKKIATGRLQKSLSYEFKQFLTSYQLNFSYDEYGRYVETGRKAGKYPPLDAIRKWCKVKGINEKAAFPIARKIYKFGIKPTPFVSEVLEKNKTIEQTTNKIAEIFANKIETEFVGLFSEINVKLNAA